MAFDTIKPLNDEHFEVLGNTFASHNIKLNGTFDNGFAFQKASGERGTVVFARRRLHVYSGRVNCVQSDGTTKQVPFRCTLDAVADVVNEIKQ